MRKYNISGVFLILSLILNLTVFPIVASDEADVDIYRKNENEYMKIALTFDDGPHPRHTPKILDILDEYGIKATFFVIGVNAINYPTTIEKVIQHGHEIGNHTYSHPHVSCLNSANLKNEVEKCESAIYGLTDYKTKLFRPLAEKLEARAMKKKDSVEKSCFWGLLFFVGIPLPGTGAWTGALIASMLDVPKKKSIPAIALGVCLAAALMGILSLFFEGLFF